MAQHYDLLVRGGTCALPGGIVAADVGIRGGRVVAVGSLGDAEADATIDAAGLHVLPGVVDSQVHFREPGGEHKETLESGTRAAVLGGVTAIFEMPNTSPPTTTAEALQDKLRRAEGRAWCDYAFYAGASPENAAGLGELERHPGCSGIKVFMGSSTGNLLVSEDEAVARVLASGRRRVAVHCEDEARLVERKHLAEESGHPRSHPEWRDAQCALRATQRLVGLARAAGRRIHVLHTTTADEMAFLADHKDLATIEVTPQHLTLVAPECYERLGTLAQMNPPIRDDHHRQALWRAVADGTVDVIGSDHAPHTKEEKAGAYPNTPSGMAGVQTLLPLLLDHCHQGRLTLQRVVDLTSAGPSRVFGMAGKGRIAIGYDADLTLVDLAARRTVTDESIASICGWTPFAGMELCGWPVATVIRGQVVMRDGEVQARPAGRPVRFHEALAPE